MAKQIASAVVLSITLGFACALMAPAGWGGQASSSDFSAYLVQGYRQMAAAAERSADGGALSSYFQQRWGLVAQGGVLAPEDPTSHALDSWTLHEAAFARRQLVERLDAGARQRQPLLAAIAQVNFDCWVAPAPRRIIQPDRDECRRRFYFAFAGLTPADRLAANTASQIAPPAPVVVPAPVDPQISRLGSAVMQPVTPTQSAEATAQACGENCVIAAFTGPAADTLISKLRQSGADHEPGADSSGPAGGNEGSRAGASATGANIGSSANSSAGGSGSGAQANDSSDSSSGGGTNSSGGGSGSTNSSGSNDSVEGGSSVSSGSASSSSSSNNADQSSSSDEPPGNGHGKAKGHGKDHGNGHMGRDRADAGRDRDESRSGEAIALALSPRIIRQ
jgi:uncharacterized membrane protein YgcG